VTKKDVIRALWDSVEWVRSGREFICRQNEAAGHNERLWQIFYVEREDQKVFPISV